MKKLIEMSFLIVTSLFLLTACNTRGIISNSPVSVKTYPSINLPYEIVDEEVEEIKEDGLEEYTEQQTLKEVMVRKLTTKENERFLERMDYNSLQDLNTEYSAVEFYFGDVTNIGRNNKTLIKFDESKSNFIYDDELLLHDLYQILSYEEKENLLTGRKSSSDRDIANELFIKV